MSSVILTVVGARPGFIKAASLSHVLDSKPGLQNKLVYTGQHYDPDMSDIFFEELGLDRPAYSLGIHGGGHGQMTGRMLEGVEAAIQKENPAMVLVYGDTNSTLSGALAAAKLHVPVAHVEAGLRSFNMRMPEEINRRLTDHVSSLLFCPTETARKHLEAEGITQNVHVVGDVMYDLALQMAARLPSSRAHSESYAVLTLHRAENTDDVARLRQLFEYVAKDSNGLPVFFPMHPRTKHVLTTQGITLPDSVRVLPPQGYLAMTHLLRDAHIVYTDSGGLQKEAYFHRVPCVTLREETEWVETIEAGWNRLWTQPDWAERREIPDYGDGRACHAIAEYIDAFLRKRSM